VDAIPLPSKLIAAQASDASDARQAWMSRLPIVVPELARRWSLTLGDPYQPGGMASWVAPARNRAGDPVVLKVGFPHYEALHEAEGLTAWDGRGAVRLLDSDITPTHWALLLEACEPATALSEALPTPEQDAVIAQLLTRLWVNPVAGHPFRPLQQLCGAWADGFERRYAAATGSQLDPGVARSGAELFRELAAPPTAPVLLCTDLHAGNVLAAQREPWLVIDPKPYVGDRTYDALQHMLNCPDRLLNDPASFTVTMAGLLDLEVERLRQWLFARCVIESVSRPDLRAVAVGLAP